MHIDLLATRSLPAAPDAAFALALDPLRFPLLFRGCGPIPAIDRITPHGAPALHATRTLENSDGSHLQERITAFEPPHRHGYRLEGLSAPLSWLVRYADADWQFAADGQGTRVRWHYRWQLTGPHAWPIAWPLLSLFMAAAMRRCLAAMAAALESQAAVPA